MGKPSKTEAEYKPGELVLSKCAHYDPYPAIVVPLAYLTKDIYRQRKPKRVPVHYFRDNTWFWNSAKTLQPLDDKAFNDYFNDKVKMRSKAYEDLTLAYKEAKAFKDGKIHNGSFEQYLRDLELLEEDQEYIEYDSWQVDKDDAAAAAKSRGANKKKKQQEDDEEVEEPKKKRAKPGPKKKEPTTTTATTSELEKETATPSSRQRTPLNKELTQDELNQKGVHFRSKLQRGLLQRQGEPTTEELSKLSEIFKELENFNKKINTEVLKASKLHKVLKAINKVDHLERPSDFKFHERSLRLLIAWEKMIIEIKNEKLKNGGGGNGNGNGNGKNETPNSSYLELNESPKKENGDDRMSTNDDVKTEVKEEEDKEKESKNVEMKEVSEDSKVVKEEIKKDSTEEPKDESKDEEKIKEEPKETKESEDKSKIKEGEKEPKPEDDKIEESKGDQKEEPKEGESEEKKVEESKEEVKEEPKDSAPESKE